MRVRRGVPALLSQQAQDMPSASVTLSVRSDRACKIRTETTIRTPPRICSNVTRSCNTIVAVTTVIAGSAVLSIAARDGPTSGNPAKNVVIATTVQTRAIIRASTQPVGVTSKRKLPEKAPQSAYTAAAEVITTALEKIGSNRLAKTAPAIIYAEYIN